MKPRPFSGSWPNFLCRLFVVVILLQGIPAQPVSNQRVLTSLPDDRHLPSTHLERWPPSRRGPSQSPPPQHKEKLSERSKTLHPVFLPYTVPVPWPTPFNGTDFAPVPSPNRPQKTTPVGISRDSDPFFILLPQFEFVPLYYNSPILQPTSKPSPSVKVTPLEKSAPKSTPQQKPAPKPQPKPAPKPQPPSKPKPAPRPQPETVQPPTNSNSSKSVRPSSPRPEPKLNTKRVKPLSSKPQPKTSDPVYENPPTSKNFVPPPKHTWTPPPENVPEYIPPSPSNLHTRSSESPNDKIGYDYVTYEPQYYTVSDNDVTYSPEIFTYTPGSEFRYDPYRNGRYDPAYYDQSAYVTYEPDIVTFIEPTSDEDGFVTYGPDTVTYTEVPVSTYPKIPYPTKPPRSSPASKRPIYVTYGPDYVTYTEPTLYEGGYITEGPSTVTYIDDAPVPSPVRPTRPSPTPQSSGQPSYITYGPETVTIFDPTTNDDKYIIYGPNVAVYTDDVPVPPPPKRPTPEKSRRPSFRLPPQDQPPYVTYVPDRVIITEPTPREDGYVIYESNVATHTEDSPPQKQSTPAKAPRPSSRPLPPDQSPYVTYRPDRVIITEPTPREDGYVTYESNVATHTEDSPLQKQSTPAKAPRPSSQPLPPDQSPYVTYGPDRVIITEPTPREDGYVTYESGVATHTEEAPVPHHQKQPTPAKSPRPSSRPPPPDQSPYGPDRVIVTEPTPREDGYVTYESDVATHTEDAPIPPAQMKPTSGKPQRPSKQPSASRPSPQTPMISSGSSAFPAPIEPEENEGSNVYYAPTYYTVVEEPNGEKAVIYESEVMSIHENEPHFEPPGEDPNLQYYELEPEYETYYEEDPGYVTYYEEPQYDTVYEPADEPQENSPQPPSSSTRIS